MDFREVDAVNLKVQNLSVEPVKRFKSKKKERKSKEDVEFSAANNYESQRSILEGINLNIPEGSMMGIIGSSGSGKTSLLNALANRISSSGLKQTGTIEYNGSEKISTVRSAYVLQTDIHEPNLTARETLRFAGDLRLAGMPKVELNNFVEQIILELGLKECADTRVGDTSHRGLSGGEKRRLSMGIQLLSNPSLLFLDEPTTGLDANSAYMVVKTCKQLARHGRTLIMSLHQPRSDIFTLFDSITLLARGQVVYSGPTSSVVDYFSKLGFKIKAFTNPADFIIDLSAIDYRTAEKEKESTERVEFLIKSWKESPACDTVGLSDKSQIGKVNSGLKEKTEITKPSLLKEIKTLAHRSALVSYRDPMGYSGLLIESVIMGVICGWIFYKPGYSLAGIRSTQGVLYVSCSMQGYLLILYETYRLCGPDLKVFDREHNEGCSTPLGFLLSRRLAKMFTEDLFVPLIFAVIMYFMSGLRTDGASHFFIYFAVILLQHYNSITYATFASSVSRDFSIASLIANLGYTLQSMACGFFVNAKHMKPYVQWTKYIAFLWYALGAVFSNQYSSWSGHCPEGLSEDECYTYSGDYVLKTYGFPENWIWEPIVILLCWSIGFYILSWAFLRFSRVKVHVSAKVNADDENDETEENITPIVNDKTDLGIFVSINDLDVSVTKRMSKQAEKRILNGVSAVFQPGSINAILGPSGSGKSTLLSCLAGRLKSNLFQQYHFVNDDILINGMSHPVTDFMNFCSYVTQEDDGLLPALTVRETLFFSACLRLPATMRHDEKRTKANDILLKMGLKDCADVIIGDEMRKGISGGEKRRVSIAVQLLSDPRVLLLDEPTSGLDSFTASSILEVLKALAEENRTIISTIHQPRSDLFDKFGNILLLAKGGRVAYNGHARNMVQYFASLGHVCPETTNIADYAMDLVSVNLQSIEMEDASRVRVNKLLENWATEDPLDWGVACPRLSENNAELLSKYKKSRPRFSAPVSTLVRRGAVNLKRSPDILAARIMQIVGIGIILALFFTPLRHGMVGVQNRIGLLQEVTALYFVGMLNNMAVYPKDRAVFYREHDDGAYGVASFALSYLILEIPFEIISSLLFSVFLVFIPGLPRTPSMYFAAVYCCFVIVNCGESLGIIFNTFFEHEGFALNIISTVLSLGSVMGGLLSLNMNVFLKAINWLSPLKYALSVLVNMTFADLEISCYDQVTYADGSCAFDSGEAVLNEYHIKNSVPHFCAAMVGVVVLYRLLAFLVLELTRYNFKSRR